MGFFMSRPAKWCALVECPGRRCGGVMAFSHTLKQRICRNCGVVVHQVDIASKIDEALKCQVVASKREGVRRGRAGVVYC